jgi:hypothetical protein
MATSDKNTELPDAKSVGWKIPEPLRRRLNSHAEYLSAEKGEEISTGAMVSPWLEERIQLEDRKRALKTLGITEESLPKKARKSSEPDAQKA